MPGDSFVFLQTPSIALVEHLSTRVLPGGGEKIVGPDLRLHTRRVLFLALLSALLPCRCVVEGLFRHGGGTAGDQAECDQHERLSHTLFLTGPEAHRSPMWRRGRRLSRAPREVMLEVPCPVVDRLLNRVFPISMGWRTLFPGDPRPAPLPPSSKQGLDGRFPGRAGNNIRNPAEKVTL